MMKKYILIMLFTLAGLAGMAQTNEPLPGDAEPLTNQLYLSPGDSTVWAASQFSGLAIKVGTWFEVDSLFKLGYDKGQVDSAINASLGDYLPLAAGASNPLSGDLYMRTQGGGGLTTGTIHSVGAIVGNSNNSGVRIGRSDSYGLYVHTIGNAGDSPGRVSLRGSNSGWYTIQANGNIFEIQTPFASNVGGTPNYNNMSTKLSFLQGDNRLAGGDPNIQIAQFHGSVLGRMAGTSDPDGYESQFATQDYVDTEIDDIPTPTLQSVTSEGNTTTDSVNLLGVTRIDTLKFSYSKPLYFGYLGDEGSFTHRWRQGGSGGPSYRQVFFERLNSDSVWTTVFSSFPTPLGSGLAAPQLSISPGGSVSTPVLKVADSISLASTWIKEDPASSGVNFLYLPHQVGGQTDTLATMGMLGDYLPLSGNAGNPMTGDIYMGGNVIRALLGFKAPSGILESTGGIEIRNATVGSSSHVPDLRWYHGATNADAYITMQPQLSTDLRFFTKIDDTESSTSSSKLWLHQSNNRSVAQGGNPNVKVASFRGSVSGRMDGTSDPDGYESQFATQDYVDEQSVIEALDEGNGIGYRIRGKNPDRYGNIGQGAVDFSNSNSASATKGATGSYSSAFGINTTASGGASAAFGSQTEATEDAAVAFGLQSKALGFGSVAFGFSTEASGAYSLASGYDLSATGGNSVAFGDQTKASGENSVAFGFSTEANEYASLVIGRYSTRGDVETSWVPGSPVFKVGNGTSSGNRSNAYVLYNDGRSEQVKDIEVTEIGQGVVIKSPDGTRWRITVDNSGNLTTTAL